ncbi:MAG: CHAT domain-containing tetratricopeptide repeat protein [Acidobacteriota bacterium]
MIRSLFLALLSSALIVSTTGLAITQETARSASNAQAADAEALYRQAVSLSEMSHHRLAQMKLFEAVNLWQQSRQIDRVVNALLRMGESHREAERWQYALECYKRLVKFPSLPAQTKTTALNSIAALYLRFHQFQLAGDYFRQSLNIASDQKDAAARSIALAGLAAVLTEEGKKQQAEDYLNQARAIVKQAGSRQAEAEALLFIGQLWREQGQSVQARQAFEDALSFYRQGGGSEQKQALLLCLLSDLNLASDATSAAGQAMEALRLNRAVTSSGLQWRAYLALARAQRAMGDKKKALRSYWTSFSRVEVLRLDVSVDAFKISLLEDRQAVYRELADMLIEEGNTEEAFNVMENARSRSTLDLIAQKRDEKKPPATPDQRQSLEEASKKIPLLKTHLNSDQLTPQQRSQLEEELKKAERQIEEIRLDIEMNRRNRFTNPAGLKQTQKEILRAGETLIEFFLGEDCSHAWLVSRDQFMCVALPPRKEIEEAIRRYTRLLAARPDSYQLQREITAQKKMARELFDMLMGRFSDKLSSSRLLFAPDGLLYYLPFETLLFGERYLVEQFDIAYTPSASVLAALERSRPESRTDQIEIIAFGDPDLGSASRDYAEWGGYRLGRLPGSRGEVLSISEMFPSRRVYLGRAATEDALKREGLKRCRRLHLATHGLIDERFPSRSVILLTLDRDPSEDGFLDVEEIAGLEMGCELVVLSACQTGRGRLTGGEGVVGLARAFLYAGARSVVVSLWNISDISAATFMRRFYRCLAAKQSPVAALRQAKIEMIGSDKPERHPYYWSSFLIVGQSQ